MLDDRDVFYDQEVTEVLSGLGVAPKWCSSLFFIFNLLGALNVYSAVSKNNMTQALAGCGLWAITLLILINHNRLYKKIDKYRI